MKRLVLFLAAASGLMWASCNQNVIPNRYPIELKLAFQGSTDFEVCLNNTGDKPIRIRVSRKEFEGSFQFYANGDIVSKAYPTEYRKRLQTDLWENPVHILKSNERICWQIAATALIHEIAGNRKNEDALGDQIMAVCEELYIQEGEEMERVDLRSNFVSGRKRRHGQENILAGGSDE